MKKSTEAGGGNAGFPFYIQACLWWFRSENDMTVCICE